MPNQDIVKLPPFKVNHVVSALGGQIQGWELKQLRVPQTWKYTKGEGITVMVIDTGYSDHKDLEGAMLKDLSKSFVEGEQDILDFNGHGSHCSGTIGARDNTFGMVGVAPECKIIACKVLGKNGMGTTEAVNKALEYAIMIRPDIVSMSLGSPSYDKQQHKLIKILYDMDIPVICAAGNSGRADDVNYPAKYPETIAVTAFDKYGKPAKFNSRGNEVDFSAPGVDIYSTWIDQQYVSISGTSMACPVVAGITALLLAKHAKQEKETGKNDCQTVEQIKTHLIKYADDRGVVGKDDNWGYGVIDPYDLVQALREMEEDDPRVIVEYSFVDRIKIWFKKLFG